MSNTVSKTNNKPTIAVTSGEPAGIGPEICLALANADLTAHIVIIGDRDDYLVSIKVFCVAGNIA